MTLFAEIAALCMLLALSALFSGSETAFFSLAPLHRERLRSQGDPKAGRVLRLLEKPHRLLAGVLSGNMLVNIGATALFTSMISVAAPERSAELSAPIMTVLLILFGEITPKVVAARWNIQFARAVSALLEVLLRLLLPLRALLEFFAALVGSPRLGSEELSEADLRASIELLRRSGEWRPELIRALAGALEMDRIPLERLGIPREKWLRLSLADTVSAARKALRTHIDVAVVFDGDEVAGVVDSLGLAGKDDGDPIAEAMTPPLFVPQHTSPSSVLALFVESGVRWAFLTDPENEPHTLLRAETVLMSLLAEETTGEPQWKSS